MTFWYIKRQLTTISKLVGKQLLRPLWVQAVEGQAFVEYALLLLFIAIAVIGILVLLGPSVGSVFSGINDSVKGCSIPNDPNCVQDLDHYPDPGIWAHYRSMLY